MAISISKVGSRVDPPVDFEGLLPTTLSITSAGEFELGALIAMVVWSPEYSEGQTEYLAMCAL